MDDTFSRLELLIGSNSLNKIKQKKVAIFGLGGVGGNVCDALARSGIMNFDLFDHDQISITNINRQIVANHQTLGINKVDAMKNHILSISPSAIVHTHCSFILPENINQIDFTQFDYVVDAVDTVSTKISIIVECTNHHIPIISSMGTGNKMHPELLEITDISKTSVCPLARVMRHELKKRNIEHVKVVYSKEVPLKPIHQEQTKEGKTIPGSTAFVPPVAGILIASQIIQDFLK